MFTDCRGFQRPLDRRCKKLVNDGGSIKQHDKYLLALRSHRQ